MNELNLKFLPLAKDIESAIPYDPAGQAISCENSQSLISVSAETPRIMVASNSNMLTQTKVFHALYVPSYDTEYLNKFGVYAESICKVVGQTGAKVIFIPLFPRYPKACCSQSGHFWAGYDGNLFLQGGRKIGYFHLTIRIPEGCFRVDP